MPSSKILSSDFLRQLFSHTKSQHLLSHILSRSKKQHAKSYEPKHFVLFEERPDCIVTLLFLFLKNLYFEHCKHVDVPAFAGIKVLESSLLKCVC